MTAMPRTVDKAPEAEAQGRLISETLAAFAHDLAPAAIPAEVRERARHLMLDATGIALASGRYDFAHKAMTAIAGLGGAGSVPVIGMPARLPPRDAALINGILVHGLDFDDTPADGPFIGFEDQEAPQQVFGDRERRAGEETPPHPTRRRVAERGRGQCPALTAVTERLDPSLDDAATRVAAMTAMALGWQVFGPFIAAGVGIADEDRAHVDQGLRRLARGLLGTEPAGPAA